MRTLYLHVGHLKTGSSWLQSSFASSRDLLRRRGIVYPAAKYDEAAIQGKTNPGNGASVFQTEESFEHAISELEPDRTNSLMYSSEFMFRDIVRLAVREDFSDVVDRLRASLASARWERISVLLFIRDPIDWLFSGWQQSLKAGGPDDFETWVSKIDSASPDVASFLDAVQALGFEVTIRNYSRHKNTLLVPVADWLGISETDFIMPPQKTVNRSLTRSEAALLSEVNRRTSQPMKTLGFALVDDLPEVKPEKNQIESDVLARIAATYAPEIEALNERLPEEEQYKVGVPAEYEAPPFDAAYRFSAAQIAAIAHHIAMLSEECARLRVKESPAPRKRVKEAPAPRKIKASISRRIKRFFDPAR